MEIFLSLYQCISAKLIKRYHHHRDTIVQPTAMTVLIRSHIKYIMHKYVDHLLQAYVYNYLINGFNSPIDHTQQKDM